MKYDVSWHEFHGLKTSSSAEVCLEQMQKLAEMRSVLDVGCGDGRWLQKARELGAASVSGVDGPWTDLDALMVGRDDFEVHDLSKPIDLDRRFDLVISLEVAEHLLPESSGTFIDTLTRHGDLIVFSAAIPYQGGYRHINERWQSAWTEMFDRRGYAVFDLLRHKLWDRQDVHYWYKQNILVYARRERADLIRSIEAFIESEKISQLPLDIVTPERFVNAAAYTQIAFRPLLRELPRQTIRKVRSVLGAG